MSARKASPLGRNFKNLLDDAGQEELVREQLSELARGAKNPDREEPAQAAKDNSPEVEDLNDPLLEEPPERRQELPGSGEPVVEGSRDDAGEAAATEAPKNVPPEPAVPAPTTNASDEDFEGEPAVIDDEELLASFLQESREHLDTIEEKILKMESSRSGELVDEVFRSIHTIKGTSSFFGFRKIEVLSHRLETLLAEVRSGRMEIEANLIDVLLAGTDVLTKMTGEIEEVAAQAGHRLPFEIPVSERDIRALVERIEAHKEGVQEQPEEEPPAEEFDRSALVTDEMLESYVSESRDLLAAAESAILDLERSPHDKDLLDAAFRTVHTIKGNAGFLGFEDHESICMRLEDVLDVLRRGDRPATKRVITTLLETIDSLNSLIARVTGAEPEEAGVEEGESEAVAKPLGELLVEMGALSEEDLDHALNAQERRIGEILVDNGKVSQEAVDAALSRQRKDTLASGTRDETHSERRDIRVDVAKLDRLFELTGELITAEAMVVRNPDLEGIQLTDFNRAANYLSKITRQMQEITMSVRMIPLEGLFNKIRRAVRDLSRKFSKEVDFLVGGQETEMDRNVIEELSDPLLHIIRNALDHGIEDTQARVSAGKAAKGTVNLSARYEGNEIWISVRDDGRGLDREKILAKAIDRQMLSEEEAASMADDQVWRLVFEAGFSTAEQVTEISGRGVGMDVVFRNIEKLRGKIDISTASGEETEFILKIPLTLAIIDGVTARVGGVTYAVPLSDIHEFYQARSDQITKTGSKLELLRIRDELIPIVELHEYVHSERNSSLGREGVFLVIQANDRKAALVVDEIIGYQQIVVKSLPEYMGEMPRLSGCSILGNGAVALIVNTTALVREGT